MVFNSIFIAIIRHTAVHTSFIKTNLPFEGTVDICVQMIEIKGPIGPRLQNNSHVNKFVLKSVMDKASADSVPFYKTKSVDLVIVLWQPEGCISIDGREEKLCM